MAMRRFEAIIYIILISTFGWTQILNGANSIVIKDKKCISIMDIPLEGPDSIFIPAILAKGFEILTPEADEPNSFYFKGNFYGIKDAILIATVNEKTKLLSEVSITCGPYRTRELFDRNQKYLLTKLQREWGNFKAKGDGSLYFINDYGYIQQRQVIHNDGRNSISYYYLTMAPYFKDASNLGLKGAVQEVITDNPVAEDAIIHFDELGKMQNSELKDRKYNGFGYLITASMTEQNEKKELTYEYDDDGNLRRCIQQNLTSGLRLVMDYRWNDDGEILQHTQKAFDKNNECIMSVTIKYDIQERDDNDNWTKNNLHITNWLKGQRAQTIEITQTRTISYWDEN